MDIDDTPVSTPGAVASPVLGRRSRSSESAGSDPGGRIDLAVLPRFLCAQALEIRARSKGHSDERSLVMVGQSPIFVAMLERIARVARYRDSVLITGESGSGKEHVAQAISLLEPHPGLPFVCVSCPQYQEGNLTVSELFGHVKGSFTGAVADHPGAFAQAHTGTLFLDEIADLPGSAQAMLLRTLSTGEYKPVGASDGRRVDVRVVAATNRSLNEMMASGTFRHDLFFRLRHFHVTVPPLRQRGDDWQLIAEYCLLRLRLQHGVRKRLTPAAERCLAACAWPGNVRQLVAVVSAGYALADSTSIDIDDIASQLDGYPVPCSGRCDADGAVAGDLPGPHVAPPLVASEVSRGGFWHTVHGAFINRDLNRSQVQALISRGLEATRGSYRDLLELLGLPAADYQRFMDFLRHHDLKPDRGSDLLPERELNGRAMER
jgi:DNA-binding NtrC family response regulator